MNLHKYSQGRNAFLLIPYILRFEVFVLLDDDEIVLDRNFLSKVTEYLGGYFDHKKIIAKAGVCLQSNGTPFFKDKHVWWKFFFKSREAMNEAFKINEFGETNVDASFVFGGNMVVSREGVSRGICFDPYITRVEDADFLINLKFKGYAFALDTALQIVHLPPKSSNPNWIKLRQGAFRFLYMKSKLNRSNILCVENNILLSNLKPHPGRFLDYIIKSRMLATSLLLSLNYVSKFMFKETEEALWNIKLLLRSYRNC